MRLWGLEQRRDRYKRTKQVIAPQHALIDPCVENDPATPCYLTRQTGGGLAVYHAMGVPPQSFARWKNLLGKLRGSAPAPGAHAGLEEGAHSTASAPEAGAPEAGEPADDALRAAEVLIQFAEAPHDAPSTPPSPPHSSHGGSPSESHRASPASSDGGSADTPPRSPPSPAAGCLMHLCGGAPFGEPTLVFRCRRTTADASVVRE